MSLYPNFELSGRISPCVCGHVSSGRISPPDSREYRRATIPESQVLGRLKAEILGLRVFKPKFVTLATALKSKKFRKSSCLKAEYLKYPL